MMKLVIVKLEMAKLMEKLRMLVPGSCYNKVRDSEAKDNKAKDKEAKDSKAKDNTHKIQLISFAY